MLFKIFSQISGRKNEDEVKGVVCFFCQNHTPEVSCHRWIVELQKQNTCVVYLFKIIYLNTR